MEYFTFVRTFNGCIVLISSLSVLYRGQAQVTLSSSSFTGWVQSMYQMTSAFSPLFFHPAWILKGLHIWVHTTFFHQYHLHYFKQRLCLTWYSLKHFNYIHFSFSLRLVKHFAIRFHSSIKSPGFSKNAKNVICRSSSALLLYPTELKNCFETIFLEPFWHFHYKAPSMSPNSSHVPNIAGILTFLTTSWQTN